MQSLADHWGAMVMRLRHMHPHISKTYTVGYSYGSIDAFEATAKILRSMMPDELGDMSLHWDSLADSWQHNASQIEVTGYDLGYSLGKDDIYKNAANELRSLIRKYKRGKIETQALEFLHFACNWVVDLDGIRDLNRLIDITVALDCELRFGKYGVTDEGFHTLDLVVNAPSQMIFERFLAEAAKRIKFANWSPISKESYLEISQINGIVIPSLQEIGNRGDGLTQAAIHNKEISKTLDQNHPQ